MKPTRSLFLASGIVAILAACSPSQNGESASSITPLPKSWYTVPEKGAGENAKPAPEAAESVQSVFRVQQEALNQARSRSMSFQSTSPWHLDGLMADFSISQGGLFGILLGPGTPSVRSIWRINQPQAVPSHQKKLAKSRSVSVSAHSKPSDVVRQMEPMIRAAVATGAVQNETNLRRNLRLQAASFIRLCRAMDRVHVNGPWHVDAFQLFLTFDAYGQVTPTVGVGGTVNVSFDWQRASDDSPDVAVTPLAHNLDQFTQLIEEELQIVSQESHDLPGLGFELSEFEVGMGLTAGGDIGMIGISGGISARLIFLKDDPPAPDPSVPFYEIGVRSVNLIKTSSDKATFDYASRKGIAYKRAKLASAQDAVVYEIPREQFREGLRQAIGMGSFFVNLAKRATMPNWSLGDIRTEFDLSIGGSFALATFDVSGQITMDFSPVVQQ